MCPDNNTFEYTRHDHDSKWQAPIKDTTMVVHLKDAAVTDAAVVRSWWLWCYAFLANGDYLRQEGPLGRRARISP